MSLPALRTVYGVLLNFRGEFDAWAPQMDDAPYKAPPRAPVLYIKPANTWSEDGASVTLPHSASEVEIGATVGMVMKSAREIAGYVLMNDWSLPHASYFRPPVKFKCLDGFLGIGSRVRPRNEAGDPSVFKLEVRINGALAQTVRFSELVRPAQQLLADVAEFMTLADGDVLMLGCDMNRPRAKAGDRVEIAMPALGTLTQTVVGGAA